MSDTHAVVKEIMDALPTQQLRVDAQAHIRSKIFTIVFKHTSVSKEKLMAKIEDLDRKLYIAEKKSDDILAADEYHKVDSAGFNK